MEKLKKIQVMHGVYWVEAPEADLYVLCGCPADSAKHLKKLGLIIPVEKDGVTFETGPNVILLSDMLMQNGDFANLAEFPVLQMLYLQGSIIPNHPNNTGTKPLLMGTQEQIYSQMQYIYRGNYGLTSVEEIMQAGITEEQAQEMMRLKLRFAFGKILKTEDLLDSLVISKEKVEIRNGVYIRHLGLNEYEFEYQGMTVSVDLNLKDKEFYHPPYRLEFHQLKREYFAVVHSGEGDGWDIHRPCMASILMYQGKIYLIDAGPNLSQILLALGISLNEVEGIFHTHAHDDHFAGLPTLLNSDHRIKYYATPLVRAAVTKKLCVLMSIDEKRFSQYFEIHDLEFDQWNNIDGLEVKPVFSPHPIETSILFFRAFGEDGYHTYAHLADIAAFDVLKNMVTEDESQPGISQAFYDRVHENYLTPVDLKKIDIGGGLIHGKAEDFKNDSSKKIILAHTSLDLIKEERMIGSEASFGMVDVLIPANRDYLREKAEHYLDGCFPTVSSKDKGILLNCPIVSFNAGSILLKQGEKCHCVYLILAGSVEYLREEDALGGILSSGFLAGDVSVLNEQPAVGTHRATSDLHALEIPERLYRFFVKFHGLETSLLTSHQTREFLKTTWLFNVNMIFPRLEAIEELIQTQTYAAKQVILNMGERDRGLFFIKEGEAQILHNGKPLVTLTPGDVFGEGSYVFKALNRNPVKTTKRSKVLFIKEDILLEIPVLHLRLLTLVAMRKGMMELAG